MNTYFSIPEPLFVLQISQLPKVAQNWFCIQNLHMELSFQKKKEILKSVHWFRRNLTNKHLNVFFETPCTLSHYLNWMSQTNSFTQSNHLSNLLTYSIYKLTLLHLLMLLILCLYCSITHSLTY